MLGDLGDFRIILKTILGDLKNVKRFKNDMILWGSYFLTYLDYFKGTKHDNRKRISFLNYTQFTIDLNNYLKDDLPNALNYIRVLLASIRKDIPGFPISFWCRILGDLGDFRGIFITILGDFTSKVLKISQNFKIF